MRVLSALITALFVTCIHAYPSGAPKDACPTLIPGHGVDSSSDPNPYTLTVSDNHYGHKDEKIIITLKGPKFMGFLLQSQNSKGEPTGEFMSTDEFDQYLRCGGDNSKSTVTHTLHFNNLTRYYDDSHEDPAHSEHHGADDVTHHTNEHASSSHPSNEEPEVHHSEHHNGAGYEIKNGMITMNFVWSHHEDAGQIKFKATVVQRKEKFWANFGDANVEHSAANYFTVSWLIITASALMRYLL